MQLPPLDFTDVSMLAAIATIILLITAELASSRYGSINLTVNIKKLENLAFTTGLVFLAALTIKIFGIVVGNQVL